MKYLFISMNYYPSNIPDSKRITGFAEHLVKKGHDVTVITSGKKKESLKINGVSVERTKVIGEDSNGMINRLIKHSSFLLSTVFVRKKNDYDVVFATSPALFNLISGYYLSRKYKSKYIIDLRDLWPDVFEQTNVLKKSSIIYKIFDVIANWSYKRADLIFVVTPGKKEKLISRFPQYENKIQLLSNGLNESFLENEINLEFEKIFKSNDNRINLVYCGKVGLAQSLDKLILELKKYQDHVNLYLIGSGSNIEKLLQIAKNNSINNVKYLGVQGEREVFTALSNADAAYVSLISDKLDDSIPTKIYEALALGVPVLLSASGDAEKLLTATQHGISVAVEDENGLKTALESILNNPKQFNETRNSTISFIKSNFLRGQIVELLDNEVRKLFDVKKD